MATNTATRSGARLLARPVSSDAVRMTSLAPSVNRLSVSSEHQVLPGQGVSSIAFGLVRFGVNAVSDLVIGILGVRPVADVAWSVVELVPVPMSGNKALGSWSVKNKSHDVVDLESALLTVVPVHGDLGVTLVVEKCPQNYSTLGLTTTENISQVIDEVVGEPRDVYPRVGLYVTHASHHTQKGKARMPSSKVGEHRGN